MNDPALALQIPQSGGGVKVMPNKLLKVCSRECYLSFLLTLSSLPF